MAGNNQTDPMLTWAVIIGLLMVGVVVAWVSAYRYIGPGILAAKQAIVYPATFVSPQAQKTYKRIGAARKSSQSGIIGGSARSMWNLVAGASSEVGIVYRKPVGIFLIFLAFYVLFFHQHGKFKNRHTLDSLMEVQALSWPSITPFLKYNPSSGNNFRKPGAPVPAELPMFAEALYPEEWVAHNRIRMVNGVPDRDQIRRALLVQLGPRFDGLDNLPAHLYCLIAAFAMKGVQKRKESDQFLGEIAKCWSAEKGFVVAPQVRATATKTLSDPKVAGPLLEVLGKHAYVATAFMAALMWARNQGGVLAPAQFVWLRGEDRTMWYPLNNMGRRAFHVEATGAVAHYQAELQAGRPLVIPRVDAAVVSIVQYLSETRATIPDLSGGGAPIVKKQIERRPDSLMIAKTKH